MPKSVGVESYLHIDGFDALPRDFFNKRMIRAGMRKAGRIVEGRAQLSIALARGQGNYPVNRTGELLHAIKFRVSRSGFLVRIAPVKTAGMKEFYPAYLWYGVRRGAKRGKSHRKQAATGSWRIAPRANYMADALQDSENDIRRILSDAFNRALGG